MQRRTNTDYKQIKNAVNTFFDKPKDVTVLGVEKAFGKYVSNVYDGITLDDYIGFIGKTPNEKIKKQEQYIDYCNWFEKQTDVKKLRESKLFREKSEAEQKIEIDNLFYDKVLSIEKEKIIYFLLTCGQKVVVTTTGEKQAEKEFLGYEFSNSRGREGIKMLPAGTMLYDEDDQYNPEKANYYINSAFNNEYPEVADSLKSRIVVTEVPVLLDLRSATFEKAINIHATKKIVFDSRYESISLEEIADFQDGLWKGEKGELVTAKVLRNTNFKLNNGRLSYDDVAEIEVELPTLISRKLKYNDIILEKSGGSPTQPVGRVVLFDKTDDGYSYSNFCTRVRVINENVNPQYLWLILNEFYRLGGTIPMQNGVRLLNLKMPEYKRIRIPYPSLEMQNKIVEEITAIEAEEKASIEKINVYKNQLTDYSWFSYDTERIENISVLVQRGKSASYGTSNIQIIKSGQARGYNEFDFSKKYYVSDTFISDERNLQKGDILINSTGVGTAGRVTLFDLDGDFVVDSHITIVRLNQEKVVPKYVLYALANIGFKNIEAMATGQSGQIELALPTVNGIKVSLPPFEKQKEIAAQINAIEKEMQKLEIEITNAEVRKRTVLNNYLK